MKHIEKIREISCSIENDIVKNQRSGGTKVIGYFCSYIPEEIIAAAGFIPYRMRGVGSSGTEMADTYYSSTNCLYPRHMLDLAMKGHYDFLDGIVFSNSCDHTRRLYDIWKEAIPGKPEFMHFLDVPHLMGKVQEKRYRDILETFIHSLEDSFGCTIGDDDLLGAVKSYNVRRELLRKLYSKRTASGSGLRGSDFLRIMLAVTALPVEEGNAYLRQIDYETPSCGDVSRHDTVNFALAGGCMEEPEFLELIENSGARIAEDNTCLGWRHFDGNVDETGDILLNISKRYLNHLSCPRISNDYRRRLDHINSFVEEGRADAVIMTRLPFCILYSGEAHLFREESKRKGYPLLVLERGYGDRAEGQYRTRIQAFVEEVNNGKTAL